MKRDTKNLLVNILSLGVLLAFLIALVAVGYGLKALHYGIIIYLIKWIGL